MNCMSALRRAAGQAVQTTHCMYLPSRTLAHKPGCSRQPYGLPLFGQAIGAVGNLMPSPRCSYLCLDAGNGINRKQAKTKGVKGPKGCVVAVQEPPAASSCLEP